MKLSDFDFSLPEESIAVHPVEPRDSAKLLAADRKTGKIIHSHFYDLPNFLKKDDFLVFNSSKVIPARLFGKVGAKEIEILLTSPCHSELNSESSFIDIDSGSESGMTANVWRVMAKPGKKLKAGSIIEFNEHLLARVAKAENGIFQIQFNICDKDFWHEIEKIGEMPLPPYILKKRHEKHDEKVDRQDYQTIYADKPGSVAAPTAGLHFTDELMKKIKAKGCETGFVDLHVGLGTFEPIRTENIEDHTMHSEHFELSKDLADRLNRAKKEGRRIIAIGTTSVRVLESCQKNGILAPKSGETDIYIYPGYKFRFVDGMITNFHLPKSSLLLLVSAFWSGEKVLEAYQTAIKRNYRFYSYGDGMFIV
ncbi:tRNA preQ1(34) S-adenosylmethionine ribosyltransferase-isomerase QueA [candidate division WS5 bacterium]|uniref:S-adenosylmethionine:tRNA ribosyltransferase-isomerase n=1 Tax=candidate division WS5 bacterium TaxID=2093353 RepID=A0A419DFG7_9BACT|nr:MAG: tRNA preQ1(34) S-adenosylmethionine ribosyltransferase-isomerase QueA [candidate division WS5 bacterium]